MRTLRGFVRLALGGCVGLLSSAPAPAQLLIAEPAGAAVVRHAELAYAFGADAPVTWLSLRAERGPLALVAALDAGARCDEGLDAWFAALEDAASTRVLPPKGVSSSCGQSLSPLVVAWPRAPGVAPQVVGLQQSEDVRALLEDQGLLPPAELPAADSYVVWSWPELDSEFTTRPLRISGARAPLELLPHASFPVLLSALTRGAMSLEGELGTSELSVSFVVAKQQTHDYHERAAAWLAQHEAPLLELRARGPIFDWSIYDGASVPPLVARYARAAARELPQLDGSACADQLGSLREPRPTPVDLAACGAATDVGLALAAVDSEVATLERLLVSSRRGVSWRAFTPGGESASPVLHAAQLDTSSCVSAAPQPSSPQPSPVAGGSTISPAPSRELEPEPSVVVVESQPIELDCSGSSEPTLYQGDEVDCSSTSSSSASADDDCSGQSYDSSEDDTDCDSDASASSAGDDGCSGDSTGEGDEGYQGYDGETCTGQAAPRQPQAAPRQAQAARPRRLRTSLWSLALAALVLPIRRRKRGLRAAG